MKFYDITNLSDTALVDLLNAVTCEIGRRESADNLNKRLSRLFDRLEIAKLDLVDQETGEVLERGRIKVM